MNNNFIVSSNCLINGRGQVVEFNYEFKDGYSITSVRRGKYFENCVYNKKESISFITKSMCNSYYEYRNAVRRLKALDAEEPLQAKVFNWKNSNIKNENEFIITIPIRKYGVDISLNIDRENKCILDDSKVIITRSINTVPYDTYYVYEDGFFTINSADIKNMAFKLVHFRDNKNFDVSSFEEFENVPDELLGIHNLVLRPTIFAKDNDTIKCKYDIKELDNYKVIEHKLDFDLFNPELMNKDYYCIETISRNLDNSIYYSKDIYKA